MAISNELADLYMNNKSGVYFFEAIDIQHAALDGPLHYTNWSTAVNGLVDNAGSAFNAYISMPFTAVLPEKNTDGNQSLELSISNVTTALVAYINIMTAAPQSPIDITYRVFLTGQVDGSGNYLNQMNPPWYYEASAVSVTADSVVLSATKLNTHNRSFPRKRYTQVDFPGLAR